MRHPWYAVLLIFATFVAYFAFTATYVRHAIDRNNRDLCAIIITEVEALRAAPQVGATGRKLLVEFTDLQRKFHCEAEDKP